MSKVTIVEDIECLYIFGEDGKRLFVISDNGSINPARILAVCGVDVAYYGHGYLEYDVSLALDNALTLADVPQELLSEER